MPVASRIPALRVNPILSIDPDVLFAGLRDEKIVLVAVSGGSDSMAMLHLLSGWCAPVGRPRLHAATVDHRLRPESAREAEQVARWCGDMGIAHSTLIWRHGALDGGVSRKARGARYCCLAEEAARLGADAIVLAHTLDDQAETVAMRVQRSGGGTTWRGLSGMDRWTMFGSEQGKFARLFRPLLGLERAQLRRWLENRAIGWIDDPGNDDPRYERPRLRQRRMLGASHLFTVDLVGRLAAVCRRMRRLEADHAARMIARHVAFTPTGSLSLNARFGAGAPGSARRLCLKALIALAGGGDYLVSDAAVAPIEALAADLGAGKTTCGRCVITVSPDAIVIRRELRHLPACDVAPGETVAWDGRFVFAWSSAASETLLVASVGEKGVQYLVDRDGLRLDGKEQAALAAQPGVFIGERLAFAPSVDRQAPDGLSWRRWTPAFERFRPASDDVLMTALGELAAKAEVSSAAA